MATFGATAFIETKNREGEKMTGTWHKKYTNTTQHCTKLMTNGNEMCLL